MTAPAQTPQATPAMPQAPAAAGGTLIFPSRAAALTAGQAGIPAGAASIVTVEAGAFVLRHPDQRSDDPLFAEPPFWGATLRTDAAPIAVPAPAAMDSPAVLSAESPAGQDIPAACAMALTCAGGGVQVWTPAAAPSDSTETDAGGRWWQRRFDSREAEFRGTRLYVNRADAARLLASDPPPERIHNVLSLEGGRLVVRSRTRTRDALFEQAPRWGIRAVLAETASSGAEPAPARPDRERDHPPGFADPGIVEMAACAGGVPLSPSHFRTHLDYGGDWFGKARAIRDTGVLCAMRTPYDPHHVIHPQMIEMYAGFRGFRYICAITAYPDAADGFENPLLYGSNDRTGWTLLPGMPQPLAARPNPHSYNSDVFMAQDPRSGELIVGWREVFAPDDASKGKPEASTVNLRIRTTRDGIAWSAPVTIHSVAQAEDPLISPGVLYDPARGEWRMWSVRRPRLGYYTAPSVLGPWTSHGTFAVAAPRPAPPHHFEIKWLGNRLVALCGDRWTGKQYFALVDPDHPTRFEWSPASCLENAAGSEKIPAYKASFLPRILPDGTWRMGLWWTGAGGGERFLRYAESEEAFAVRGWGRAAEDAALGDAVPADGGYAVTLLTPTGRPATLVDRARVRFTPPVANGGADPRLTVNGRRYAMCRRAGGILAAGDLKPGVEYEIELRARGEAVCLDFGA